LHSSMQTSADNPGLTCITLKWRRRGGDMSPPVGVWVKPQPPSDSGGI